MKSDTKNWKIAYEVKTGKYDKRSRGRDIRWNE